MRQVVTIGSVAGGRRRGHAAPRAVPLRAGAWLAAALLAGPGIATRARAADRTRTHTSATDTSATDTSATDTSATDTSATDTSATDTAAVARFVAAYRARTGLPGAAVAITRGGRVEYVAEYGTAGDGTPVSTRTRLPIASLSKSVTALAVMQLVEAGHVALDVPVRRYLPEFVLADARVAGITVRQLLAHTSGMADTEFREKSVPPPPSLRAAVALLRPGRLASAPGARRHYHNPNYWVAARLVEVVSGEPFAGYLRRHVFEPAGMHATTTVGTLHAAPDVAWGHVRVYGGTVARPEPDWYLDGASGVVTTAEDLARWLVVQSNGGVASTGAHLLSAEGIRTLQRERLGWDDGPEPGTVAHVGWLFTFTAQQVVAPAAASPGGAPRGGYALAVVANRGLNLGPDDADAIVRALLAIRRGAAPPPPVPVGRIVDAVLLALTALVGVGAARSFGRTAAWVAAWRRRRTLRGALPLVAWSIPIIALAGLRRLVSFVFGGRDGTWGQLLYVAPSLVGWLAVSAACGCIVVAVRARALGVGKHSRQEPRLRHQREAA